MQQRMLQTTISLATCVGIEYETTDATNDPLARNIRGGGGEAGSREGGGG